MSDKKLETSMSKEEVGAALEKMKRNMGIIQTAYAPHEWLVINKKGHILISGSTEKEASSNYIRVKKQEPVYITQVGAHLSPEQKAINFDLKPKLPVYG